MAKQTPVTCRECGKRKVKALVTNPITGAQRRSPIKICQDCHPKTIDYKFFKSSFGQWLRRAFHRQCTNSIPKDTQELRDLLHLWRFYKAACGFCSDGENVVKTYDYHLCHIDPVKGEDDAVGRLIASNLVIAPAVINRGLSNLPYPFTSKQSVSQGELITDDNFTSICRERYDLSLLTTEFGLNPKKRSKVLKTFKSDGVAPTQVLSMELKRLGYPVSHLITCSENGDKLANEVFEVFFTVGGTLAVNFLAQHGSRWPSSQLDYDFTLPYDRMEQGKARRKENRKEEEEWW